MKKASFIILVFLSITLFSQKEKKEVILDDLILIENDSIIFDLDEVTIFKKLKFKNTNEKKYYYWYWKKIHKAYPYAVETATILNDVNVNLKRIKSNRKRKKYIRKAQKLLNEEFKGKLKKLTRTEGKLLIRLIHRQTGFTVFNLIKEYRSGWKAFWYNSTANLFKLSLKKEYHPEKKPLDFLVEDILQRAFVKETLKEQKSVLDFNYIKLTSKYKKLDIIKLIDER